MAHATATAGTWGISGPTFLLAYTVLALAVGAAGVWTRKALADRGATSRSASLVDDLSARPYEIAHLGGGGELAVYSALSAMHVAGTITAAHGSVRATGRPGPDADELEKAIHATAFAPVLRRRLPFHRNVQSALAGIEGRLVSAGLLLSEKERMRIRHVGFWMLGVALFGLVRVLADIAEAQSVGSLLAVMAVVAVVAAVQLTRAPRRSRQGDLVLAALRREHDELSPDMKPDWQAYGPAGAAIGTAIFGTTALWTSDTAFAGEIEAQRISTGGNPTD